PRRLPGSLFLEERQMADGHSILSPRCARLLGNSRVQQSRRPLERGTLRMTEAHADQVALSTELAADAPEVPDVTAKPRAAKRRFLLRPWVRVLHRDVGYF